MLECFSFHSFTDTVLCQSGMVLILIITALLVLWFGFVDKAGLTVFGLLLCSACTASRLSLFPTLCPSVRGRKGSEWVLPRSSHQSADWEAESQLLPKSPLHLLLFVPKMTALSATERRWLMMSLCSWQLFSTCNNQPYSPKWLPGKFVPQCLHTGLNGLLSPDLPSWRGVWNVVSSVFRNLFLIAWPFQKW